MGGVPYRLLNSDGSEGLAVWLFMDRGPFVNVHLRGRRRAKVRILQPRPAGARSRGLAVGGRWAMYDIKDITPEEAERLLKELEKGADEKLVFSQSSSVRI